MPRNVPSGLLARIESGAWNPAILVKVTTKSGETEGYTSSPVQIVYSGVTYAYDPSISLSNLEVTLGTGVDNTTAKGALVEGQIESDLVMSGKYDGATWDIYLCDFENIGDGVIILATGVVGEISISDLEFEIDHLGLSFILKRVRAVTAQKTCRCTRVGDGQCQLNMAGSVNGAAIRQTGKSVTAVTSQKKMTFGSVSAGSNVQRFTHGFVKFTTGANAGIERQIKASLVSGGSVNVETILPFPFTISIGDQATLEAGCNGKLKYEGDATAEPRYGNTCVEFGNGTRFRGEHFLPGNASLARTVTD